MHDENAKKKKKKKKELWMDLSKSDRNCNETKGAIISLGVISRRTYLAHISILIKLWRLKLQCNCF